MKKLTLLVSGGIGSGKSFVLQAFNALGIPSYDADSRAKGLYDSDPQLLADVVSIAGQDVVRDGRLDRKVLASRIFSSVTLKEEVEALVHPAVMRDFDRWRSEQDSPIVIMESAILMEHPALLESMDYKLVVTAPLETRIDRVALRDSATREQIMARMASQWGDDRRVAAADFVVENDGVKPILPQIIVILNAIFGQYPDICR